MILTLADRERLRSKLKASLKQLDNCAEGTVEYDSEYEVAAVSEFGFDRLTDLALAAVLDFDPKE
jgi:hypothetical protein